MVRWAGHQPKRSSYGLNAKEYLDAVYVLYCREFLGAYDVPFVARDRAGDTFLTPDQLRRKENAKALKQMGILK